jgi:hypothetical protein
MMVISYQNFHLVFAANQSKVEAKEVSEPNDEELQIEIQELLKNADFTTVWMIALCFRSLLNIHVA